ncbi:SDR family NAD(P)-dependent oxidoreductase [Nonomuraea candida]|uniref:SDR family NAD(P)-dependent oxidoreductase n=1 Tax=Nonomuraea candida TaxID=359159 RepID=UPI000694B8A6|nr:SDR family NAD(P)-dependent oxidoreductase [Nonomuraea candida]
MRTILVTGATSGLGLELANRLMQAGDRVIAHGRDPDKLRDFPDRVVADLAELRQVDRLADEVLGNHESIDVLVNNAGVGGGAPGTGRELSADGIELRFAVNYLAGYHLARRLLPITGRVVNQAHDRAARRRLRDLSDSLIAERLS